MSATLEQTLYKLHINGEATDGSAAKTFPAYNPATGEVIGSVAEAGAADVDRAVQAARAAFEGAWAKQSPAKRGRMLFKLAELLRERLNDLAALETANAGKPISWSKGEIMHAAEVFEYYAGAATKIHGESAPVNPATFSYTVREPIGVCAQIIPWNFPLVMAAWKLAPALAAGNTVVLKPAEQTPITALKLAELCLEAGMPAGVVNVLNGPGETVGAALVAHPGVDKVAFTGSTEVGKKVMAEAAKTMKRVTLELGGKSPNLVFEDANLAAAVDGALYAIFDNAGQCCNARSRIFVHEAIHDAFVAQFVEKAQKIRQGDPTDPKTQMGALISEEQWKRVDGYVKIGASEGAKVALGGDRPSAFPQGHFYQPTVLTEVTNRMRVAQEEIFGPVVTIQRFSTEAEAIALANETEYGLFATVYTNDVARAHRVASRIRAGGVTINTPGGTFPGVPFGGYKQSGFGRELSMDTLNHYTEEKTVLIHTSERPANPFGV
jgi:acyl-CoA reductase-like NAD-dependent aldehyde dehydrogenase